MLSICSGTTPDVLTYTKPVYQGSERLHCPAYVCLIKHASDRQILFDLGLHHGCTDLPPQKVEVIDNFGWHITAGKPLAEGLGDFTAHDFFGDGSFFLVNTPGHMKSHMCDSVRMSNTQVCVHGRRYYVVMDRSDHPATVFFQSPDRSCIYDLVEPDKDQKLSSDQLQEPFYRPSPGVHQDLGILEESLKAVRMFDGDDRMLILLDHGSSVSEHLAPRVSILKKIDRTFDRKVLD